jgi:hypothetical protein
MSKTKTSFNSKKKAEEIETKRNNHKLRVSTNISE